MPAAPPAYKPVSTGIALARVGDLAYCPITHSCHRTQGQNMESRTDRREDPLVTRAIADLFSRVAAQRNSRMIVDQVRALIRKGLLSAGDRLPSERELGERFGVSRVTVREALRTLEAGGLATVRVGVHGGAFITTPTGSRVTESITDVLSLSTITPAEVMEARHVFATGTVPIVCERADRNDVSDLFAICDRAEVAVAASGDPAVLPGEFHIRVAQATHNAAIELMGRSFYSPMLLSSHEAASAPRAGEYRNFVVAVSEKDVHTARTIMSRLLCRSTRGVEETRARSRSGRVADS